MLPDSNLNIKIGYCVIMNNAGKTLFNQRDVIKHHFSYIYTSLIQTVNKSPVIGMFVIKYHLNNRSWPCWAAAQPSESSSWHWASKVFVLATHFARSQGTDVLQTPWNLNDSLKDRLQMKMNSHYPFKHDYITQLLFIATENQIMVLNRTWLDD